MRASTAEYVWVFFAVEGGFVVPRAGSAHTGVPATVVLFCMCVWLAFCLPFLPFRQACRCAAVQLSWLRFSLVALWRLRMQLCLCGRSIVRLFLNGR